VAGGDHPLTLRSNPPGVIFVSDGRTPNCARTPKTFWARPRLVTTYARKRRRLFRHHRVDTRCEECVAAASGDHWQLRDWRRPDFQVSIFDPQTGNMAPIATLSDDFDIPPKALAARLQVVALLSSTRTRRWTLSNDVHGSSPRRASQ